MWTLLKITLRRDIRRYQKQQMYYYIVVLKYLAKLTGMDIYRSLFSSCNLQHHWKRDASIYSFLRALRNFLGALLLRKPSCELGLKGELYEKRRASILIIIKIYREVGSSFKKQTLQGKVYI